MPSKVPENKYVTGLEPSKEHISEDSGIVSLTHVGIVTLLVTSPTNWPFPENFPTPVNE